MSDYQLDTKNCWFPEQQEPLYDPTDPISDYQFKEYWKRERDRCINGFTLAEGKVKIPGPLYFHTVYWSIARYVEYGEGKKKRKVRIITQALLRDIDWDMFNDLERCREEGRFYGLVGSRDFGKSVVAASLQGHNYTFFENSESVTSGGAENYIKLATDKIEDGLLNIHPVFKKQRLKNDWSSEVRAGWKDKKTNQTHEKSSNSRILVRNYKNGTNSMAANGTRPGIHLIDEIGTIPNLIGCIKDSDGCWWSGGGDKPSCLVMLCGTGGDMEKGQEAADIFFNPESYNLLEFENVWEDGRPIGRFVPATRAKMAYKEEKTLAEYLNIDHPDLKKIIILVSNEEKAKKEWWDIEYKKAFKSGNPKTLLKFKAYWPLVPSDSFIVLSQNDYNIDAAKIQLQRLRNNEVTGSSISLYYDGEGIIKHKFVDKLPITEFPVKTQSKDAPIVVWEFPIKDPPRGLYIAGIDPYRQDESEYSDSLGAIYIYKRMHEISSEKFQDMFVAAYVARPKSVDEWCENARMLLKYYNAVGLCENDDMTFIRYMMAKGDAHYLEDQPLWLKEVVPGSRVERSKGIHRSSEQVRKFLRGCLKRYLDDIIHQEKNDEGSVISEVLGVSRVMDPMLLEEIIKYNKEGNFDRVIAAELAVALAEKMKPMGKFNSQENDPRIQSLRKPLTRSIFSGNSSFFSRKRPKLF